MSQKYSPRIGWRVISFIILQPFMQGTFCQSYDWCWYQQKVALYAEIGQNISHRLSLNDNLRDSGSFVWSKGDSTLLELTTEYYHSYQNRYKATTVVVTNGMIAVDLEISFTTQDDSGEHATWLYKYGRRCTIGVLKLTIVSEPICSTILHQENNKIQMSCQWEQLNVGEQAQIVARNETIYEHEAPLINIDGLNSTRNKFSVYFEQENIIDAQIVPTRCFVAYSRISLNMECQYIPIQHENMGNTLNDHTTIDCCTSETNISWWYLLDDQWFSISVSMALSFIDVDHVIIVCGVENEHELVVHSIGIVKFKENLQIKRSLIRTPVNTNTSKCEDLTLNVTTIQELETSTEIQPSTFFVKSVDDVDVDSNKKSIDMEMLLLLVLVLSTLAHAVSIAAFVFSFWKKP